MALARATPLLTTLAQVVGLTSVQDIANLETDSEFSAADTLLRAHEWVFDRLKRRFPTGAMALISNTEELERAVAYRFLEILGAGGYVGSAGARAAEEGGRSYFGDQAREEVDSFQPEYTTAADAPRRSSEGLPVVGHIDRYPMFTDTTFYDGFPSSSS